jgi:hypothetical protein
MAMTIQCPAMFVTGGRDTHLGLHGASRIHFSSLQPIFAAEASIQAHLLQLMLAAGKNYYRRGNSSQCKENENKLYFLSDLLTCPPRYL